MNDLRFFASLQSLASQEGYGTIDDMIAGIPTIMFDEYGSECLSVWQSFFKRYRCLEHGMVASWRSSTQELSNGRNWGSWRQR